MIKVLSEFEALGNMAALTIIFDFSAVRISVAGLAVGIIIIGRHIFEDLIHMTGNACHVAMFAG